MVSINRFVHPGQSMTIGRDLREFIELDRDDIRVESAAAQRLAGGWVKPLVTTFFDFTRVCERSERLDFRVSPTGGVAGVNLLGAKVKTGHVNVGGRLWAFHDVEPGATAKAEKLRSPPAGHAIRLPTRALHSGATGRRT